MRTGKGPLAAALAAGALAAVALVAAGCGGAGGAQGRRGGTLTVLSTGDVDSLDPGYAYYQYDYQALTMPTQRALYGWPPNDTKPRPDLAAGMPRVSDGGRTVTVRIKDGIRFSPPVNRPATSRDVKYAIERGFLPQVGNGYADAYFGDLVGLAAFKSGKARDISGLRTPDDRTIVLHLRKPSGVIADANALSLPLSVPVPEEYAAKFDRGRQSSYGSHQVFTGPYMLPHDATGKVTSAGYQPGKQLTLVRNPSWRRSTDFRPAYLDKIVFLGGNDATVASRRILTGRSMLNGDLGAPPTPVLKQALATRRSQLAVTPGGSFRYVALDTRVPPFDNLDVRKAVIAGSNRTDLVLTRGGRTVGTVATHFIPPGLPGFQEAGGYGTNLDFLRSPGGNMALAASYLRKAGFRSGRYTGRAKLLMVGDDEPPAKNTGEAVQAQLQALGFKLSYRQVPHDSMISKFCGVPKAAVAICPNGAWGKDFYDSRSILDPTFNGRNISPQNNANWPQLDDRRVNAAIERAKTITDPAAQARAWGAIDRMVTSLAPGIPWAWDNDVNLRSTNVNGVTNRFNSAWDVSFTSLK